VRLRAILRVVSWAGLWGRTLSCGGSLSRLALVPRTQEAAWEAAAGRGPAPQSRQPQPNQRRLESRRQPRLAAPQPSQHTETSEASSRGSEAAAV